MPIVYFTYEQRARAHVEASCKVPSDVVAKGADDIQMYLESHESVWEIGETTNDYEDRISPPDITIVKGDE